MKNSTFKAGQKYGNYCTIEVISRTAKTITINSNFGTQRIKVRNHGSTEVIYFKCWTIEATEFYNSEKAAEIFMDNMYYR
jgi:hypothetical protein